MMIIKRKISFALLILVVIVSFLVLFAINPIFSQIKTDSQNFVIQKKELLESEAKIKNIQDFEANFRQYQSNLDKIDQLFVDISEPIGFIKLLESEAGDNHLSIEIAPPTLKISNNDLWQVFEFSLNLKGSSSNFLRFLERLESAPYLIQILNLNIRKDQEIKNSTAASLLIDVYAK